MICQLVILNAAVSQKKLVATDSSWLTGTRLPGPCLRDGRGFFVAMAQSTLEVEAGTDPIREMEVLVWENKTRKKTAAVTWLEQVKNSFRENGWSIIPSTRDTSFSKLVKQDQTLVMYMAPGKQEANLYLGKITATVPVSDPGPVASAGDRVTDPVAPADTAFALSTDRKDITGNWGDISISKVNYYDPTGYMVGSGLSHGSGYEFKDDGTYVQTSLATSSRPDYKIFLYTRGKYSISGNQLTMIPIDLYYRKWEDDVLVTNEHSVPPTDVCQWSIRASSYNGKPCLYLKRMGEAKEREYCKQ